MTKLNLSDIGPLACLLFVFFLIGVLTGGYLATHNTEREQDCQCQCSCCVKEADHGN